MIGISAVVNKSGLFTLEKSVTGIFQERELTKKHLKYP